MNCIWTHGTYFIEYEGDYYHHNLTLKVWEDRYLRYFDKILVCSRVKKAKTKEDILGKHLSIPKNDNRLSFQNLNCGLFNNNKNVILNLLRENDTAIIRLPSINGYAVSKFAKSLKKPYLTEVVGCALDALSTHSLKGKIIAPVFMSKMKSAVKNADFSIYVTEKFLQRRYKCKGNTCACSDVLINDIDEDSLFKRIEFCRQFDLKKQVNLTTIGAVDVKYKGQEYVLRAIADLNKQGYNFKYTVIGGGNYQRLADLSKELNIENYVNFTGNLTHEEVFDQLDNTHIYIHPSLTEGMPRSVLEAQSRGCTVICSDVGGIPEIVNKEFLFKKKNVSEIKKLLCSFNAEILEKQAYENINFVKEFSKRNSFEVRDKFFSEFKQYCKGR